LPEFQPLGREKPADGILETLRAAGDVPIVSMATDLDGRRRFGRRWLVLGRDALWVVPENGAGDAPRRWARDGIDEVKVERGVGGAVLMLVRKTPGKAGEKEKAEEKEKEDRKDAEEIEVVCFSNTLLGHFTSFAVCINRYLKDAEVVIPEIVDKQFCSNCGRMLPEENAPCPKCFHRLRTLWRVFSFGRPFLAGFVFVIVMAILGIVAKLYTPQVTKELVNSLTAHGGQGGAWYWWLVRWVGLMFLLDVTATVFQAFSRSKLVVVSSRMMADLRGRVSRAIELQQLKFFDKRHTGALVSRVSHDTMRLQEFLAEAGPYILINLLILVGVSIWLFIMNWRMAFFILLPIPVLILGSVFFWGRIHPLIHKWWHHWSHMNAQLTESFSGIRVVKAFGKEEEELSRFGEINERVRDSQIAMDRWWVVFHPTMEFLVNASVYLIWLAGGWFILRPRAGPKAAMDLGTLIAFIQYFMMVLAPLQWFAAINQFTTRALVGAERVFDILDSKSETYDAPGAVSIPRIRGAIEFENVFFGYEKGKDVLRGVTFNVKAGEMVGLVGKSGVGKTTIINLICRFYETDRGVIRIDGVPINELKLADLRHQTGMVLQESFLFDASVLENIRYSKPGATFEEIVAAARMARAHDFILAKPDGYHTHIGERGVKLSGGEKQRISIARAILHNPAVLILDEPTSSVDTETEKEIQVAVSNLVRGRTTIAIAHRLSTLRNADRLVVLDEGKVVEQGTHQELLASKGIYQKLVKTQTELSRVTFIGG
jgi:ATP-binding cassette subfamily B protein